MLARQAGRLSPIRAPGSVSYPRVSSKIYQQTSLTLIQFMTNLVCATCLISEFVMSIPQSLRILRNACLSTCAMRGRSDSYLDCWYRVGVSGSQFAEYAGTNIISSSFPGFVLIRLSSSSPRHHHGAFGGRICRRLPRARQDVMGPERKHLRRAAKFVMRPGNRPASESVSILLPRGDQSRDSSALSGTELSWHHPGRSDNRPTPRLHEQRDFDVCEPSEVLSQESATGRRVH